MGRTKGNTLAAYSNQYKVHWECLEVVVIQESRGTTYKRLKLNGDKGSLGVSYEAIIGDRRRKKKKETGGHSKLCELSLICSHM